MKLSDLRGPMISALRWTVISRVFTQLITWSSTIIAVRLLTPTDYGIVAVAMVFANYLQLLGEAGLGSAIVQQQVRDRPTLSAIFSVMLITSVVLACAIFSLAPMIGAAFNAPRAITVMRVVALAFALLPFLAISESLLQMDLRFKELGIAAIAGAVAAAVSVVGLALAGAGPYALVGSYLLGLAARACVMQWYARAPLTVTMSLGPVRKVLRYSILIVIDRSIGYWYRQTDYTIVARVLGTSVLGTFTVAKNIVQMPLDRIGAISNGVSFPTYSLIQQHEAVVSEAFLKSLRVGSYIVFPMFWGLGAIAAPLVAVAFGEKWDGAVLVMQILAVPMPLRALEAMLQPFVRAIGRPGSSLTISAIAILVIIPLQLLGVMHFGVAGVAGAWAVGYPFIYVLLIWLFTRTLSLNPSDAWLVMVKPVLCTLLMTGTVMVIVYDVLGHELPWLQLVVGSGAGVAAY